MDPSGLGPAAPEGRARIIVIGNHKGGTGKSTTAMHMAVALLGEGLSVATVDLDGERASLTRYVENRRRFAAARGLGLAVPDHHPPPGAGEAASQEARLDSLLDLLAAHFDTVIVDCPGAASAIVGRAFARADVLVTPVNDSFLDLDLLARVEDAPPRILGPSRFSEFVWEEKKARARRDGGRIDWVVVRHRMGHHDSRNRRAVGAALMDLARRFGFKYVDGFGERVVFRELFPQGLTVLDLRTAGVRLTLSHVAARQEVRRVREAIGPAGPAEGAAESPHWMGARPVTI